MTRNELSTLLRVSPRTIQRMELRGELRPIRVGVSIRYLVAEIDELLHKKEAA